jgi:3-hydroxyisobutyrate dehydrogenase-like beta-hydroxyacid dehydrogenase
MDVGFVGIGQMGGRMSRRILDSGHGLVVHDVRQEAAQHLIEMGARWMDSPKGVAQSCRVVLTSLPGPPEVEEVVNGPNGLAAGWQKGDVYVDMTTNSPDGMRRIARDARAMGVDVLDAPVSGGVPAAEAGTLSIMVGGDGESLERVRSLLDIIGNKIFHAGDIGCGSICKLVNNMIALGMMALNAESFVLGVKAGIDPRKLWEIITASTGNNPMLQGYPDVIFKGNFSPFFGCGLGLASKDISLAHDLAEECGLSLPICSGVHQDYLEAKAAGYGSEGPQAVFLPLEEKAGVQVR